MADCTLKLEGLSKDLPGSLRLLLKLVIDHVPSQALAMKLDQTRQTPGRSARTAPRVRGCRAPGRDPGAPSRGRYPSHGGRPTLRLGRA
jgi:hypothetical protein